MPAPRRVWALLGHDPDTGCATAPAGVVGIEGNAHEVSWIPYAPAAMGWRARFAATTEPLSQAVETWLDLADGVSFELVALEASGTADLRGDVEVVVDELMAAAGEG